LEAGEEAEAAGEGVKVDEGVMGTREVAARMEFQRRLRGFISECADLIAMLPEDMAWSRQHEEEERAAVNVAAWLSEFQNKPDVFWSSWRRVRERVMGANGES
jgi:hypothetical protein